MEGNYTSGKQNDPEKSCSSERGIDRENVILSLPKNGALRQGLKKTISNVCSSKKHGVRDTLLETLGCTTLHSLSYVTIPAQTACMKSEIAASQRTHCMRWRVQLNWMAPHMQECVLV